MKINKAIHIFENINSDKYTSEEKCEAIYEVTKMPTHNSITKASMLDVIEWMLDMVVVCFPDEEAEE